MSWKRGLERSLIALAVLALGCASLWAFRNRETLIAACLNTVSGISDRFAHGDQPFGLGTTVESANPVMGIVPDFSLTERSGRPVGRSDLLGSYWVASFMFTRCVTSCPMAAAELSKLQKDLPPEVRLVSISVDPDHDSPEVLARYAEGLGAGVDRWLFLTGDRETIYRAIREGFQLAVESNSEPRSGWEVTHSPRFALVDPEARIRGYYESAEPSDMERLRRDIRRLLGKAPPTG